MIRRERFVLCVMCFLVFTSVLLWNTKIHTCDASIGYIQSIELD